MEVDGNKICRMMKEAKRGKAPGQDLIKTDYLMFCNVMFM